MNPLEERIKRFIRGALERRIRSLALPPGELDDEFSLVESGLLDSMGFIALVTRIEKEFDLEVDFEDADPDRFTTLGGLARCAARHANTPPGGVSAS